MFSTNDVHKRCRQSEKTTLSGCRYVTSSLKMHSSDSNFCDTEKSDGVSNQLLTLQSKDTGYISSPNIAITNSSDRKATFVGKNIMGSHAVISKRSIELEHHPSNSSKRHCRLNNRNDSCSFSGIHEDNLQLVASDVPSIGGEICETQVQKADVNDLLKYLPQNNHLHCSNFKNESEVTNEEQLAVDPQAPGWLPYSSPLKDSQNTNLFNANFARNVGKNKKYFPPIYSPDVFCKEHAPSQAASPPSSFANSPLSSQEASCKPQLVQESPMTSTQQSHKFNDKIYRKTGCSNSLHTLLPSKNFCIDSTPYIPGVDLLIDKPDEFIDIDMISRFSRSPTSSPKLIDPDSVTSCALAGAFSSSHMFNQLESNAAQRNTSSAATSSLSAPSAGMELSKATKERYAHLRQQRKRMQPAEKQPLPALHLHLSKDGTSPLPPGWQRAVNTKRISNDDEKSSGDTSGMYAYYYYHVRTRQTRWDPPVYPWDADPTDTLSGQTGDDDPEAPYNWGCASRFAVTHSEIEAMYTRIRQRMLERQCTELLHELADKPDAPQGEAEQGFAIELFTLVHNTLRAFRDARCKLGRIANDEDLYYLTKKLAQAVILKEVQKFHQSQIANASSLFSSTLAPEVTTAVQTRVTTYVKKYMESKGAFYRRRVQQLLPSIPHHTRPDQSLHLKTDIESHQKTSSGQAYSRPVPLRPISIDQMAYPNVNQSKGNVLQNPTIRVSNAASNLIRH